MDAAQAKKAATYEDLIALPDRLVGEIVDGDLYASPRPAFVHALATSSLMGALFGFGRGGGGPGGWLILIEPELHIGGQVMVPDLAGWRRERMPEMPDVQFSETPPDWVCEVLSPSTAFLDRRRKMPHYATAGVRNIWLVDARLKTVEVYRSDGERWLLLATHGEDERVRAEPFEAIEIDLSLLWAR
jgi:Uma2 family endonuclease